MLKLVTKTEKEIKVDHIASGKIVKAYRMKHKLTTDQVAVQLSISQAYYSDLENGRRNWTEQRFAEAVAAIEQLSKKGN